MNTEPPPNTQKPQWLTKLEEESWQAELIISGLAIYGTLQLPGIIEWLIDWCLAGLSHRFFILLYLFFTYLGIGVYLLIFIFIGHFVLRAVWIGFVGLNSVYPQGVNEDSTSYSAHFIRQFKADYADQNSRIGQLDRLCSVLFGLGAQLMMIFLALNIDILAIGALWYLADSFLGPSVGNVVGIAFFAAFFLFGVLFFISNTKKFKDRAWVKKWQYPIYKKFNAIFLHIFSRHAPYLAMVFQTNLSLKRYTGMVLLMMLFVFFFFGARFLDHRFVSFIRPNVLYDHFDRSDRLIPEHYANLRGDNRRLFSLELESDVIREKDHLRVFVPILSNENQVIDQLCGEPQTEGSKEEKRRQSRAFYSNCYQGIHRFYVNDSLYQVPDLIKYEHPNQEENGILVYLPGYHFREGRNVLKVEKSSVDSGSVARTMQAVFWYERE